MAGRAAGRGRGAAPGLGAVRCGAGVAVSGPRDGAWAFSWRTGRERDCGTRERSAHTSGRAAECCGSTGGRQSRSGENGFGNNENQSESFSGTTGPWFELCALICVSLISVHHSMQRRNSTQANPGVPGSFCCPACKRSAFPAQHTSDRGSCVKNPSAAVPKERGSDGARSADV